jgi:hypothetical protein
MTIKGIAAHARALPPEVGPSALAEYYPPWLKRIAPDATVESSLLEGAVQGAEAVRSIVSGIRSLYGRQQNTYAAPYGKNGFVEDYVAFVDGQPIVCVVLVNLNDTGETQHVTASYRPRSALQLLSRLLRKRFAGSPAAKQLAPIEP